MWENIPQNAVDMCIQFEGFESKPYRCPAGIWTIGYGSTRTPERVAVTKDTQSISEETAKEWLMADLARACCNSALVSPILLGFPEKLGAITDFLYNLGAQRYVASTLRVRVNEGDWTGARKEILKWVWGGGRRLPGLVRRRYEESTYL